MLVIVVCAVECLNSWDEERLVHIFQLLMFVRESVQISSCVVHDYGAVLRAYDGATAWPTYRQV